MDFLIAMCSYIGISCKSRNQWITTTCIKWMNFTNIILNPLEKQAMEEKMQYNAM